MKFITMILALAFAGVAQDVRSKPNVIFDKKFAAISTAVITATAFDLESTFRGIRSCNTHETNPVMRPIINSGRPASYGFHGSLDLGVLLVSRKLRKEGVKHWWWVLPVADAAA